ncbi:MAG: hypothetical protein IPJ41_13625 [Phycisphaerales bacterium]|nr:hypothetical protein [Phycisphaerales bacterium]
MATRMMCVAGATASICGGAIGQVERTPQRLDTSIEVTPVSIARAIRTESGVERVGDWIPYGGSHTQRGPVDELVFDCFNQTGDCATGSLWYFGTAYCNGFATNDMTVAADTVIPTGMGRVDFAWYWSCGGFGTEQCVIGVWTQESVPCDLDSFDYSGWLLNYGTLSCNPGGYYYSNVDISSVGTWPVPSTGTGSYVIGFLTSSGAALATCAQPMLWGTGDARGDPTAPGTQGPNQLDDDNPVDGAHTSSECYTYALGYCPPLGTAAAFWGERGGDPCAAFDCDGNGVVDTRDFSCFFNLWVPKNIAADCDGNGVVDTRDFTCFLNGWVACR